MLREDVNCHDLKDVASRESTAASTTSGAVCRGKLSRHERAIKFPVHGGFCNRHELQCKIRSRSKLYKIRRTKEFLNKP
ncbi:MAG: hypothetical protein ACFFCS_10710 [Candidatus Hodarchaeota archaeon]